MDWQKANSIKKFHEIGIAVTTYKIKNASDKYAAMLIFSGFTAILKNWWDNYLSKENKDQILGATTVATAVKIEGNMQVTEQEAREDASATLGDRRERENLRKFSDALTITF